MIWDGKITEWNFILSIRKISLQVEVVKEKEGNPKCKKWQLPTTKNIILNNPTVNKSSVIGHNSHL